MCSNERSENTCPLKCTASTFLLPSQHLALAPILTDQVILPIKLMAAFQGRRVSQVFTRESANSLFEVVSRLLFIITTHTLPY